MTKKNGFTLIELMVVVVIVAVIVAAALPYVQAYVQGKRPVQAELNDVGDSIRLADPKNKPLTVILPEKYTLVSMNWSPDGYLWILLQVKATGNFEYRAVNVGWRDAIYFEFKD